MSLSPEMIGVVLTAGSGIVYGAVNWGINSNKVESMNQDAVEQWKAIDTLRKWKDDHEKHNYETRFELAQDTSKVRESVSKLESKLDSILSIVKGIQEAMERRGN